MGEWCLGLDGRVRLYRNDMQVRLRTQQQGLLLARLAAHRDEGVCRVETAYLLWPEAERSNALAYLRRAAMELRHLGLPIESSRDRLWLPCGELEVQGAGEAVLDEVEHPIGHEVRSRFPAPANRTAPHSHCIELTDSHHTLARILRTLSDEHPDVAVSLLARHGLDLVLSSPPEPMLELVLRALAASEQLSKERLTVMRMGAWLANLLTRYSLAERLLLQADAGCIAIEDRGGRGSILSLLAFVQMERRQWEAAVQTAFLAVELSDASGEPSAIVNSRINMAGIQWHLRRFEEAAENYAIAYAAAEIDAQQRIALANATLIWGLYGVKVWKTWKPCDFVGADHGVFAAVEGMGQAGYGIGVGDVESAVMGVTKMLRQGGYGLDRIFCVALDLAAVTYGRFGRPHEAAACVRVGTRYRSRIGHSRSPAEKLSIRLHVKTPFFGEEISRLVNELGSDDDSSCAERIIQRLNSQFSLR